MKKNKVDKTIYAFYKNIIKEVDNKAIVNSFIYVWISAASSILASSLPAIATYVLEQEYYIYGTKIGSFRSFVIVISIVLIIISVLNLIKNQIEANKKIFEHLLVLKFKKIIYDKYLSIDYEDLEKTEVKNKFEKAKQATASNHASAIQCINLFSDALLNLGLLCIYTFFLGMVNIQLIIVMIIFAGVSFCIRAFYERIRIADYDKRVICNRKSTYLADAAVDYRKAKEIRMFSMKNYLRYIGLKIEEEQYTLYKKLSKWNKFCNLLEFIVELIRDTICFYIMWEQVTNGNLGIAAFLFYYTFILQFMEKLDAFIGNGGRILTTKNEIKWIYDFMNLQEKSVSNKNESAIESNACMENNIIFAEDIAYAYSENNLFALKHISFAIKEGMRIAIVGNNGAGKTTLMKMLIGLYKVQKGNLRCKDIKKTGMFQKGSFLPVTIAENVGVDKSKSEKVVECLELSGIYDKISALPNKENTKCVKEVYDDAVDFSGGEIQKIMLARALFNDGDVYFFDEPCSAMDALSEEKFYRFCEKILKNKTIFFVTHRYHFTPNCDLIIYMENGSIEEIGIHDDLMKLRRKYWSNYTLQEKGFCPEGTNEK